jgi:DNA-binding GntR family transcriptional regulator
MTQTLLQPVALPKTPRYREAAYRAIKEAILDGRLEPEQPLVEEKLAALLNISRTPVREALALLEHERLIGPRGGKRLYVHVITRTEFVEMFVANETIEPYLARRAALRAADKQLEEIRKAIERGQESTERADIAGFLRSGRDFHRLVGVASGNGPLTQFVVRNEERTDLYLLSYGKVVNQSMMQASNREHEAIFEAISRRDPEAAARLVIYHTQSLRERFSELFNDDQTEAEADGRGAK